MDDLRVEFPEPCREKWEAMELQGCNRHCASCDKTIYDLSSMTTSEAEMLLNTNDEVCVRASVGLDGKVRTADHRRKTSRRMMTAIGASLSLATAACQTPSSSKVSPRYEISGELNETSWASTAQLQSGTGKTFTRTIRGDRKFRFSNLRPGTYTLSFIGICEEVRRFDNIVVNEDVVLSGVETQDVNDCIIVGRMQRADEPRNG